MKARVFLLSACLALLVLAPAVGDGAEAVQSEGGQEAQTCAVIPGCQVCGVGSSCSGSHTEVITLNAPCPIPYNNCPSRNQLARADSNDDCVSPCTCMSGSFSVNVASMQWIFPDTCKITCKTTYSGGICAECPQGRSAIVSRSMIEIRSISLREIHLPLREPFRISSGDMHDRRIVLLEVEDAEGFTAWSECVGAAEPNYSPETTDTAWLALRDWLVPRVLGRRFADPAAVDAELQRGIRGHWMARAALEMVTWELLAQRRGEPLATVLGDAAGVARDDRREKVAVGISLGLQDTVEALAERVERELAVGYRKIKLKIKPGADVEFLAAVRRLVGDEVPLGVDANAAYTLDDLDTLKALDQFGLIMIEQPLAWDDLVDHSRLQAQMETPLCLDESITGVRSTRHLIELGAGRIVNIKPGRVGGFTESLAIHALCREYGIPVWCGGMLEGGIGRAYNVALASLPGFVLPGDLSPSARYWHRDIVDPEWTMDSEGWVTVPVEKPGMGVKVDRERVEALTTRQEVLRAD